MRIKILPEDRLFSRYVRTRDKWTCQRCGGKHEPGSQGLHCSHYFTRGNWATRFDEENCIALCWPCHMRWGGDEREQYKDFMVKWLGKKGFQKLVDRSNEYANKKKVRAWAKEYYKI